MSLLATQMFTLLDLARLPENKDVSDVINMLAQLNPILEDAPAMQCNKGPYHETSVKTGLPTPVWGRLYKGIPAGKGNMQTVRDTTGFLTAAAQVDTRLVDVYEKMEERMSVRLDMANDNLEAMSIEAAKAIFYHDTATDPEKPMGLSPRFSSTAAANGSQIILGGGAGSDNMSIWLITWGKQACHLLYPKGSQAGIKRKDCGEIPVTDSNGDIYMAYREEFEWHLGLTVRNWQYVARIANIDVSDLTVDGATGAKIINLMTEAYYVHKGRRTSQGSTFWYMGTTAVKYLDYQSRLQAGQNLFLTWDKVGANAKEVLHFRGIAIRETDALLETESAVS